MPLKGTEEEIDLVIEHADGSIWAIKIKRSLSEKVEKGFYIACEGLQPTHSFAVHAREERHPISENIETISLYELTHLLSVCSTSD